jgi:guanine nucleotide-exchange factor
MIQVPLASFIISCLLLIALEDFGLLCLVSILNSSTDWEQLQRYSLKQGSIVESHEEDASRRVTTDETESQEDGQDQFERAKTQNMETAISEVGCLQFS